MHIISLSVQDSCGGSLIATGTARRFSVPGYPFSFSDYCTWTINAAEGSAIRLDIQSAALENCYDNVTIYDGKLVSILTWKLALLSAII